MYLQISENYAMYFIQTYRRDEYLLFYKRREKQEIPGKRKDNLAVCRLVNSCFPGQPEVLSVATS